MNKILKRSYLRKNILKIDGKMRDFSLKYEPCNSKKGSYLELSLKIRFLYYLLHNRVYLCHIIFVTESLTFYLFQ